MYANFLLSVNPELYVIHKHKHNKFMLDASLSLLLLLLFLYYFCSEGKAKTIVYVLAHSINVYNWYRILNQNISTDERERIAFYKSNLCVEWHNTHSAAVAAAAVAALYVYDKW